MFEAYAEPSRRRVMSMAASTQTVRLGPGALWEVGEHARGLGIGRALLVTDATLLRSEAAGVARRSLEQAGVEVAPVAVADRVPLQADVGFAAGALHGADCDGVVSLGGGSVLDVGKGAALMGRSRGTLHGFAHGSDAITGASPHIAVPTTAGTGTERSGYAFIIEKKGHEHLVVEDPALTPDVALVDPVAHLSMPPRLTATTGVSALAAAVEAYLSPRATSRSDRDALEAMRLVAGALPRAVRDGDDLDAREGMARAATLAGGAFETAGIGVVDGISLAFSSMFGIDYSTASAAVLPHVLHLPALSGDAARLDDVAASLGHTEVSGAEHPAVTAVQDLRRRVGLEEGLQDLGVSWNDLYLVARAVLRHPFAPRQPRPLDEAAMTQALVDTLQRPATQQAAGPSPSAVRGRTASGPTRQSL